MQKILRGRIWAKKWKRKQKTTETERKKKAVGKRKGVGKGISNKRKKALSQILESETSEEEDTDAYSARKHFPKITKVKVG